MLRLLRSEVRVPPSPICDPTDKNLEILEIQTFDPQIRPKVQKLVRSVQVFALYASGSVLIFTPCPSACRSGRSLVLISVI